jgi:hypothetical protein
VTSVNADEKGRWAASRDIPSSVNLLNSPQMKFLGSLSSEVSSDPMVIIALFGGLVVGGALFAVLKNSGSKSSEGKYTKLDIG